MSHATATPRITGNTPLEKLGTSLRGKLQFMDYLIRATLADVDRFHDENDAGTRIFIRQLIEMHASNLATESENMRLVSEFCASLENVLNTTPLPHADGDEA